MPWHWARLGPLRRSSASPPHMIHTWHHLTILATHCVVHRTTCLAIWWWTHAVTWQDVVDIRLLQASNKDSLTTICRKRTLCVASTCLLRRAQPWSSPQLCLASAKSLHQLRMAIYIYKQKAEVQWFAFSESDTPNAAKKWLQYILPQIDELDLVDSFYLWCKADFRPYCHTLTCAKMQV